MGHHKKSSYIKKLCKKNIIGIIALSLGIGLIMAVLVPFWIWIIIAGTALVVYGIHYFTK